MAARGAVVAVALSAGTAAICKQVTAHWTGHGIIDRRERDRLERRKLAVSAPFLGTLGVVLVPSFVVTAVFFHQSVGSERRCDLCTRYRLRRHQH
jgi:hypothetical protein